MKDLHFIELELETSRLMEQKHFYAGLLQLPLVDETAESFTCQIGSSRLRFVSGFSVSPFHFAINIPSNQIEAARQWLHPEIAILPDGPNEIVFFESWNAHAIYFRDADGNIVELIARHKFGLDSDSEFGSNSFLHISEVGMPSASIEDLFLALNAKLYLPLYSGNYKRFCAAGTERGLFILVDQAKKQWFPTEIQALPVDFKLKLQQEQDVFALIYSDGKVRFEE